MRRYLAVLVVLVALVPSFSYIASGDGTPITVLHGYSGLRENFQLAYIDVDDDSERMHLFLSVASLNPGENLTILVPLRTHPSHLSLENTTSWAFKSTYGFSYIHDLHIKQTNGTKKFGSDMRSMFPYVVVAEIGGVATLAYFLSPTMGAGGISSYEHYETHGLSVDVYSFNSTGSLSAFYDSMNAPVPQNVRDTITRYGDFSVAVIRTVTKPPIPRDEYDALETYVPDVMDDFRDFVKTHDEIYVLGAWPSINTGDWAGDSEFHDMLEEVRDTGRKLNYSIPLDKYFRDLVFATYGIGDPEGFEISMKLSLYEGKAFFPLGTSPAWGKVGTTEIMFSCPDSHSLSFNSSMEEAFSGGKHYYLWKSENSAPNYDLEGKLTRSEDTGKPMSWTLNGILYDISPMLSFLIYLSAIATIWVPIELFAEGESLRELSRRDVLRLLFRSYVLSILSLILSFFITLLLMFALFISKEKRRLKLSELRPEFRIGYYLVIAAPLLFIVFLVLSFFALIAYNYSTLIILVSAAFVLYFGPLLFFHILAYRGMKTEGLADRKSTRLNILGIGISGPSLFLYPSLILHPLPYGVPYYGCGCEILLFILFILPLITASAVLRNLFRDLEGQEP